MTFDWTVNVGGVAAFVLLVVTILGLHRSNIERIYAYRDQGGHAL